MSPVWCEWSSAVNNIGAMSVVFFLVSTMSNNVMILKGWCLLNIEYQLTLRWMPRIDIYRFLAAFLQDLIFCWRFIISSLYFSIWYWSSAEWISKSNKLKRNQRLNWCFYRSCYSYWEDFFAEVCLWLCPGVGCGGIMEIDEDLWRFEGWCLGWWSTMFSSLVNPCGELWTRDKVCCKKYTNDSLHLIIDPINVELPC